MADAALPLRQRAEQLAATMPPLLVAAERVASTVAQGVHGRRRVGQGETFWQFRGYYFGDSPQSIDWRQSAKSDRVFVREMEWEAAQSVWLWRDASPSMSWRSSPRLSEKRERAELLLLALTAMLVRSGERVALLGSERRPTTGRATLSRLGAELARGGDAANLPPHTQLPRYAQVVLFGDFLGPLEEVDAVVRRYGERDIKGHLLQILDPAEETLPYEGRVRFEGLEDEAPWLLSRTEAVRGDFAKRLSAHREGLRAIAQGAGWSFACHHTDQSPHAALLALYAAMSRLPGRA